MNNGLLKIEEVAVLIGRSTQTIDNWYAYKRQDPNSDLAKLLPDYIQQGAKGTRYWKREDIWELINFKNSVVFGRNGKLGSVTQKYRKTKVK